MSLSIVTVPAKEGSGLATSLKRGNTVKLVLGIRHKLFRRRLMGNVLMKLLSQDRNRSFSFVPSWQRIFSSLPTLISKLWNNRN